MSAEKITGRRLIVRHTAALALVGWYLMTAPVTYNEKDDFWGAYFGASMGDWDIRGVYDTARACSNSQDMVRAAAEKKLSHGTKGKTNKQAWAQLGADSYAECIATDDPRLKEK
jgi:hypothetical protein